MRNWLRINYGLVGSLIVVVLAIMAKFDWVSTDILVLALLVFFAGKVIIFIVDQKIGDGISFLRKRITEEYKTRKTD
jgi:hypothetical protein